METDLHGEPWTLPIVAAGDFGVAEPEPDVVVDSREE